MMPHCCAAIVCIMLAASVGAQTPGSEDPARVDIGNGFSVTVPLGSGWQKTDEPATYLKQMNERGHSLVLMATTRPSGITSEDIRATGGDVNRLIRLIARFQELSWKLDTALDQRRFEKLEVFNESSGKYSIGKFTCAYSRVRVLDQGAIVEGAPTHLRFVAYSCMNFVDDVAAHVSYSERGREQDLSDELMGEGERFARSLRRGP